MAACSGGDTMERTVDAEKMNELQEKRKAAGDSIKGPKKLCMFGAPYIWGILKGTGLAGLDETDGPGTLTP